MLKCEPQRRRSAIPRHNASSCRRKFWMILGTGSAAMSLAAAAAPAALRLELTAAPRQIAVYEAVPLTITLHNNGDQPLTYNPDLFEEEPIGEIVLQRPGGVEQRLARPKLRLAHIETHYGPDGHRARLAPGERQNFDILLSCDWDTMAPLFTEPGTYRITAAAEEGGVRTASNTVQVEVIEPPAADRAALDAVTALEAPAVLYEPGLLVLSKYGRMIPELEALAGLNNSTIYANYAKLTLARYYVTAAGTRTDPARRAEESATARQWLERLSAGPEFTLAKLAEAARARLAEISSTPNP